MTKELALILILLLASEFPITSNEVLIYQVEIIHENQISLYNYTFIINSLNNNFVNFTLIITNLNNGSVILNNTYVYPILNLKVLPINGVVFNGENFTFSGYTEYHNQNATVYKGYFIINTTKIPSTAYFVNNILYFLNGSGDGYSVSISLSSEYTLSQSVNYGGYIILGIIVAFIVIGVVILIKIGKI
ncbi:hypothetical protein [Sulfurisphaera ohwakuensis]|uniref:Uncharacterized protein n=1 Tax=Sulfurisphaera ohwakuensis TaxID=69656 RepID=A0A650CJ12_SULOH|nr:hypothetical protein [Sulfurisphaera ohwakuensis]MBB5253496.1 hypothetical protein [Sulfurisphaera ohwakuensis]QGR17802.1 hypothetical protein D1869_11900 [Sulfurisphaera ohwakuensis]